MTNEKLLYEKIRRSGMKIKTIATACGLSYQGFFNKAHNKSDFTATEIQALCTILNITGLREKECIFFAENDD